jgi:acetyl-CoA C-acetyltransferase
MSGIKDKVAIIGMGCTKFGERFDKSADDLILDCFLEALEDSGIEKKDINAAWMGCSVDETSLGKSAIILNSTLKMPYTPVTRTENYCATGTEAFRGACYAVASGAYDIALALGVEKLKDTGFGGLPPGQMGTVRRLIGPNSTAPGEFAQMANGYFARYGIDPEEGKRILAHISVKSHHNGMLNPKAHLRKEITIEDVLKAPIIASPLGLFDCCGVSDGAACAIVTTPEIARKLRKDPIYIKAMQIAATSGEESAFNTWDGAHVESTYRAGIKAYEEAEIKNPRQEISMMEVHDCFSITELTAYEDLQISPRGRAREDVESGFYDLNGQIPCQPDGGLKCFGHPTGASGLRMIYEVYKQLQGKAGPRQIQNAKLGITHNMGGIPSYSLAAVTILGN